MQRLQSLFIFLSILLIAGCKERSADLDSPKSYSSEQITFQYPGNWKVTSDNIPGNLTLETPGDAIVIVQSHPPSPDPDITNLAKKFSEDFIAETPIGEIAVESMTELENQAGYQRILEKFNITLLGQKIPHHRLYAGKGTENHSFLLIFQAPSDDFEKTLTGFELILKSLQPAM